MKNMEEISVLQDFEVEIIETLSKIVKVNAKNEDEALENVAQKYRESIIILDSDNHVDTEFKLKSEVL